MQKVLLITLTLIISTFSAEAGNGKTKHLEKTISSNNISAMDIPAMGIPFGMGGFGGAQPYFETRKPKQVTPQKPA